MKLLSIILTIIFIFMQISGIINWPWYGIISPILILIALWILIIVFALVILLITAIVGGK